MNGNREVLQFSLDDMFIKVLDNDFLPYSLKDYLKNTDLTSPETIKRTFNHISSLKDYLCSRTLNISRDNAKAILHTNAFPQSMKTKERLKIVMACDGLSITDNFWLKQETDKRQFDEVNLRNHHLSDAAYEISILGKNISVTKDIMLPDLGTDGMFAKTWVRNPNGILLWKTDMTNGSVNAVAEKEASDILDKSNVNHIKYSLFERDGLKITSCECIANDDYSIINAFEIKDWCEHTGKDIIDYIEDNFMQDFAKMCVADYVIANTDRHLGNINFIIDNKTNSILSLAPLFDHNQSLIADRLDADVSEIIYDITNRTLKDTAVKYYPYSKIIFDREYLPEKCASRLKEIEEISSRSSFYKSQP